MFKHIAVLLVLALVAISNGSYLDYLTEPEDDSHDCGKCNDHCGPTENCCYGGECKNGKCTHMFCSLGSDANDMARFKETLFKRLLERELMQKKREEKLSSRLSNKKRVYNKEDMDYNY